MNSPILFIIFILLLIDSIGAVATAWVGGRWYTKHFRLMSRYFPMVKGWTMLYLALVLFIGCILRVYGAF